MIGTKNKLFVLALDEFDVLFYDRRGKPSDFIYKLLVMEEKLREQGHLVSIVAISNNVMSDYEKDDRVRSRIGSSEIFFNAYTKKDVLQILNDRASAAFSKPVDPTVLEYCAEMSSSEHGDARRAIDLLRVAAEIASSKSEAIEKKHVDRAAEQLQKDRISLVLSTASYHFRLVAAAIAKDTYVNGEDWHSTSSLYDRYCNLVQEGT
ncbi:cell division control protein 6 [Candidatus Nitrososphaera gargensis Ga9.2]|uniref:Cell division control protein 6 n=1 Tax=Nitrososphaera gargensis (strain Ga9.2) TaxID=1237085 RepID=K0ILT8_NITGG|nr:cell division control protein 6 [Candidatus Nitrososphaera gargensis]AFU57339.1 cell division control protein 6 [Candidatus Nitrososphaera gargensis Ga9.2]